MSSPTSRTKKLLEGLGWEIDIVERYNSFVRRRFDLFNFADLLCIAHPNPPGGLVAVQATSGDHHANRKAKIIANPKALRWLQAGGHIWLITWSKKTKLLKSGKISKSKIWAPRTEIITEDQFDANSLRDTKAA